MVILHVMVIWHLWLDDRVYWQNSGFMLCHATGANSRIKSFPSSQFPSRDQVGLQNIRTCFACACFCGVYGSTSANSGIIHKKIIPSSHHPIPHRWSQRSVNPLRNLVGGCSPTPLKNHGLRTSWDYNIPNCFWKVSQNSMASNHQPDCFWGVLSMAEGIHQNPSMVPFFGPGVPRPTQTPHAGCEPWSIPRSHPHYSSCWISIPPIWFTIPIKHHSTRSWCPPVISWFIDFIGPMNTMVYYSSMNTIVYYSSIPTGPKKTKLCAST